MREMYGDLFTVAEGTSEERYDLAKLMPFVEDTYDVLNSPILLALPHLPLWRYYKVDEGYKDIDLIAEDAYGSIFYASLVQIYNGTNLEVFEEGTVLKLFNVADLEALYANVMNKNFDALEL